MTPKFMTTSAGLNRKLLVILGLPSESADTVMERIEELEAQNAGLRTALIGLCDLTCTADMPRWLRNASYKAYLAASSTRTWEVGECKVTLSDDE